MWSDHHLSRINPGAQCGLEYEEKTKSQVYQNIPQYVDVLDLQPHDAVELPQERFSHQTPYKYVRREAVLNREMVKDSSEL